MIPEEALTTALSEFDPVRVVMLKALIIPVVKASRVFRTAASIDVSLKVTASFPKPAIFPATFAEKTAIKSAAFVLRVVILDALIIPVVKVSRVFSSAAPIVLSLKIKTSFPKPVIFAPPPSR